MMVSKASANYEFDFTSNLYELSRIVNFNFCLMGQFTILGPFNEVYVDTDSELLVAECSGGSALYFQAQKALLQLDFRGFDSLIPLPYQSLFAFELTRTARILRSFFVLSSYANLIARRFLQRLA